MINFLLRLDDASDRCNIDNWDRIEELLDKYNIHPLVGVIPNCQDEKLKSLDYLYNFWSRVQKWQNKNWVVALHGYNHVYNEHKSEFSQETLFCQRKKIHDGLKIMNEHGIYPKVFFAPSHSFDDNTILALKLESDIRVISDTIAYDSYFKDGITFVPQQSGLVRFLPLKTVTFCYHPNTMTESQFDDLEKFLIKYSRYFRDFPIEQSKRKYNKIDFSLSIAYKVLRK